MSAGPPDLPSYDPQEPESLAAIPERFVAEGYLGLTKSGRWQFQGEPITHPKIPGFLWRRLRRTTEGQYWVVNGPQRVLVRLEDAPFVVIAVDAGDDGRPWARLSDGTTEALDVASLCEGAGHVLYAQVKAGQNGAAPGETHRARLRRTAVQQLEPWLVEADGTVVLRVDGADYLIEPCGG